MQYLTCGVNSMNNLSENIRSMRLARGLNQVEFGKIMGVTKQCVSNWENDNVMPSLEMAAKMADFFSVSIDCLIGRVANTHLDVHGLSEEEIAHITLIVNDLRKKGK